MLLPFDRGPLEAYGWLFYDCWCGAVSLLVRDLGEPLETDSLTHPPGRCHGGQSLGLRLEGTYEPTQRRSQNFGNFFSKIIWVIVIIFLLLLLYFSCLLPLTPLVSISSTMNGERRYAVFIRRPYINGQINRFRCGRSAEHCGQKICP